MIGVEENDNKLDDRACVVLAMACVIGAYLTSIHVDWKYRSAMRRYLRRNYSIGVVWKKNTIRV